MPASALTGQQDELLAVLLHAMVHWVNAQNGIADCNHAGYHNLEFKQRAEAAGFEVGDRQPRFGWTDLRPGVELRAALAGLRIHRQRLSPLAAALPPPATDRSPPRCKPNLPTGEAASPYWRTAEALIPTVPRYRIELRREAPHPIETYPKIHTTADAAALFWQLLHRFDREALAVLFLDTRRRIGYDIPYIGTLTRTNVEPRGILTPALLLNAAAVVIAHNHPSGDATPSREDELFTRRVVEAGKLLGIEVVGSIVVGGRGLWRRVSYDLLIV